MKKISLIILVSICSLASYSQIRLDWKMYSIRSEAISDSTTFLKLANYLLNNAFQQKHTDIRWKNLDLVWDAYDYEGWREEFEIPIDESNKIQWNKATHKVYEDRSYSTEDVAYILNVLKSIPVSSYSFNCSKNGFNSQLKYSYQNKITIKVGVVVTEREERSNYVIINMHTYSLSIEDKKPICAEYTYKIGNSFARN